MSLQRQTWCPGDKGRKEGKRKEGRKKEGRRERGREERILQGHDSLNSCLSVRPEPNTAIWLSVQLSHSVVSQLCDPTDCSTPGFPVHPSSRRKTSSVLSIYCFFTKSRIKSSSVELQRELLEGAGNKCDVEMQPGDAEHCSQSREPTSPGGQGMGQEPSRLPLIIFDRPTKTTSDQ